MTVFISANQVYQFISGEMNAITNNTHFKIINKNILTHVA